VRIDLQSIADRNRASTTPVREAIHRLIGERLVEPHPDGGFQIALPEVSQLLHLYVWNVQHLLAALHILSRQAIEAAIQHGRHSVGSAPREQALAISAIFSTIGRATGNSEFIWQMEAVNERLHYPRIAEVILFGDTRRELRTMTAAGDMRVQSNVRRRILTYHRRRIEHVSQIYHILTTGIGR
jgi:DNA-binding GntR family transcriptional regulator